MSGQPPVPALERAIRRWRDRLGALPGRARLAAWQESGFRLVVPGGRRVAHQLDDLGDARPLLLWVKGTASMRLACLSSVAMVGSRAATA